jgi:hypothetical protein
MSLLLGVRPRSSDSLYEVFAIFAAMSIKQEAKIIK